MAKPSMFKIKCFFFKPVRKNTQQENKKKMITIHNPLVDGPSNNDLPINEPIALENDKESCCKEYHNNGIDCKRMKNIT